MTTERCCFPAASGVLLLLTAAAFPAFAHDTKGISTKPTKAQPKLNQASRVAKTLRKQAEAKKQHQCCTKSACVLCSQAKGSCSCAHSMAGKQHAVCGDCLARWKEADRGKLQVLSAINQAYDPVPDNETSALIREYDGLMLEAKRILTAEKRYACCIRGGCNSCAQEGGCSCGTDLAAGKGVCGECMQGWNSGKGSFPGIDPASVQLASGLGMQQSMQAMGPGGGPTSGWYSSGTSQEPRESGMPMVSVRLRGWELMGSGQAFLVYTEQSGPRGKSKLFAPNWGMLMASHQAGSRGTLTLRSMLSLEPATITNRRYPLLFATGETAFGVPIVNGQHPHDLFMELAATYQVRLGERTAVTFYGGPRGEPALGPPAFPHRASASENPVAVLAHHIQDSTHVANNVVTAGFTHGPVTWEVSAFNGREPGEQRWGLARGALDSWSSRLTVTPSTRWSGQVSVGRLSDREFTHPGRPALRTTASLAYSRELSGGRGRWSSMLIWGRNHDLPYTQQPSTLPVFLSAQAARQARTAGRVIIRPQHFVVIPTRIPGQIYNSFLAETTLRFGGGNWIWGRAENADRDSTILYEESPLLLLVDERRYGRVQAYTMGYERQLWSREPAASRWLRPGLGAQVMLYRAPNELAAVYGSRHPVGLQIFLKVRLGSGVR